MREYTCRICGKKDTQKGGGKQRVVCPPSIYQKGKPLSKCAKKNNSNVINTWQKKKYMTNAEWAKKERERTLAWKRANPEKIKKYRDAYNVRNRGVGK